MDPATGGVYILYIHVAQSLEIVFGRYAGGAAIPVPSGNYAYVGSALAPGGATSLPRRLLRHLTRTAGRPPHRFRPTLQDWLRDLGFHGADPPQQPKHLRWHIDYLLDAEVAEVAGVQIIQDASEAAVAAYLAANPRTWPLAPGLGASDDRPATHLLGLHA